MPIASRALVVLALLGGTSLPCGAQDDGLTAVCDGGSITVSFAGVHATGNFDSQIGFTFLWRRDLSTCGPWTAIGPVQFQPGQAIQTSTVDADVTPDKLYLYKMSLDPNWSTPPTTTNGWRFTHYEAYVGCGAAPIAHGLVRQQVDPDGASLRVESCPGSCYPDFVISSGQAGLASYVDRDEPVALFGSVWLSWQGGWLILVDSYEPRDCEPMAVEAGTWSHVKSLYRD